MEQLMVLRPASRDGSSSKADSSSSGSRSPELAETSDVRALSNQLGHQGVLHDSSTSKSILSHLSPTDDQHHINSHQQQQQSLLQQKSQKPQQQQPITDYDEVKQVELFGECIVALTINAKERLCLAQISNTLLKEFSYNEIHNRRVALGITCVQCTPIQLEVLRRAGAMPSSSRRCGMITRREADRLCRSFLVEEQPPELPENFYFTVAHKVNYGCKGRFVPARYISSRAKCIECFYCGEFYSPNKFIFHSHRLPHNQDCNPPDSPNINSWRKHIDLDWTQEHNQDIKYAWEDVKSLFNGGTRRRATGASSSHQTSQQASSLLASRKISETKGNDQQTRAQQTTGSHERLLEITRDTQLSSNERNCRKEDEDRRKTGQFRWHPRIGFIETGPLQSDQIPSTEMVRPSKRVCHHQPQQQKPEIKCSSEQPEAKLFSPVEMVTGRQGIVNNPSDSIGSRQPFASFMTAPTSSRSSMVNVKPGSSSTGQAAMETAPDQHFVSAGKDCNSVQNKSTSIVRYPSTSNFIYNQLYTQLVQPRNTPLAAHRALNQNQLQLPHQLPPQSQIQSQTTQLSMQSSSSEAQIALRHHLWASLLANLRASQSFTPLTPTNHMQNLPIQPVPDLSETELQHTNLFGHFISTQFYQQQQQQQQQHLTKLTRHQT